MNNNKGMIIVVVLAITLITMLLGAAAIQIYQMGYLSYGSEKRYRVADQAAEYGVLSGIKYAVDNNTCPTAGNCSGALSTGGLSTSYTCFSFSAGNKCFIQATGTFGGAKVIKNVIIPTGGGPADYGALTLRDGGTVQMGGSAAIVSCMDTCERPGLMYGGSATLQIQGGLSNTDACPNNPKGIYGSPYAVTDKDGDHCVMTHGNISCPTSTAMGDLVPKVFNSTDWANFVTNLGGTHNGHSVDVTNLAVSDMPSAASAPSPGCTCTNSSITLAATTTSCAGVVSFDTCAGQVKFTGTLTINGIPSNVTTIVSPNSVNVTSVPSLDGNFQGKSIYATGTGSTVTINDSSVALNGSTISAGGGITLQSVGSITNGSVLSTGGNITFQSVAGINDPAHPEYSNVSLVAGGNVTLQSAGGITKADVVATGAASGITIQGSSSISSSTLVTTGSSGSITIQNGSLSQDTLVTKSAFTMQSTSGIADTNVFAGTVTLQQFNADISGGIFYSQGNTTTQGNGNGRVGTVADPTLVLTGGQLILQHTGTPEFNGLVFANGQIVYQAGGNFKVNGAIMGNSTSANTIQTQGNPQISFNPTILNTLAGNLGGRMQSVNCNGGGGNRQPYISSTKVTVY